MSSSSSSSSSFPSSSSSFVRSRILPSSSSEGGSSLPLSSSSVSPVRSMTANATAATGAAAGACRLLELDFRTVCIVLAIFNALKS